MALDEARYAQRRGINLSPLSMAIIALIIVVGLGWGIYAWKMAPLSGYHAVFLSNGQVYFGKVSSLYGKYAVLSDVYYLQLKKPLQNQQAEEDAKEQKPQLSLIKLGRELHGPEDGMRVNRQHVLFIEKLKDDSSVVKAINEYKKQQAEPKKEAGSENKASQ